MNKLNKIFLAIIIILIIALAIVTYYLNYYRNAYFFAANEMIKMVEVTENNKSNNIE